MHEMEAIMATQENRQKLISVVVPAYNECEVIHEFHTRLMKVLDKLNFSWEIIYVNDGSTDETEKILQNFHDHDKRVGYIDFTRNFGKEIALTAGIDRAKGDAVIVIDADLQDPPELIPELLRKWLEGNDVVYAKRTSRIGETKLKKVTAQAFYRVINKLSKVKIPEDTGDFRLLSRRSVESLLELREYNRFMKGLFSWIGYEQIGIPYNRDKRYAGKTKWNYWKLWNFALDGITSFTTTPLLVASYLGLATSFIAFIYVIFVLYKTLFYGNPVAGYPSLMCVILFLGGIQLLSIGVIGEYIGRIFNESKKRPLYLIKDYVSSESPPPEI